MADPWLLALATMGLLGVERAFELRLNRRNVAWLEAHGARFVARDGFALILAAQVLLFAMLLAETLLAPWSRIAWWTWPALALALVAQGIRYWAITTLGPRWCIRVATLPGAPPVASGPYRLLPHPNYLAVALEALALPLAFSAWATLAVVLPLQIVALARRIRIEDEALGRGVGAIDSQTVS